MTEQTTSLPSDNAPVKVDTGDDWRRLSPIAIVYFTVRNIINTAQGLVYAIPAIAVSFNAFDSLNSPEAHIGIAAVVLITTLSGVVSFLMYKFRVHNQHVEIHTGVFQRRYTNLPLWRIQNVKIEEPVGWGFDEIVLEMMEKMKDV